MPDDENEGRAAWDEPETHELIAKSIGKGVRVSALAMIRILSGGLMGGNNEKQEDEE